MLACVVEFSEFIQVLDGSKKLKSSTDNGSYAAVLVDSGNPVAYSFDGSGQ
jgi:hypothetical protein